ASASRSALMLARRAKIASAWPSRIRPAGVIEIARGATGALHQGVPDDALQPCHLLADGRLGVAERLGRRTERTGVADGCQGNQMVRLAGTLADKAWKSDQTHTIYFEEVDDAVDPQHPRAHTVRSAKNGIAYDYIPPGAPVR